MLTLERSGISEPNVLDLCISASGVPKRTYGELIYETEDLDDAEGRAIYIKLTGMGCMLLALSGYGLAELRTVIERYGRDTVKEALGYFRDNAKGGKNVSAASEKGALDNAD